MKGIGEKTEAFDHQPSIKQARLKTRRRKERYRDREEQEKRILTMNIQQVSARGERGEEKEAERKIKRMVTEK